MVKIKTKVTPVRYPGGKSNALKFLEPHFPRDFQEYREPFFGGGSVGLYLMQTHKDAVYVINDLFYPVFCFWWTLYNEPQKMVQYLLERKATYTASGTGIAGKDIRIKGVPTQSAVAARELHKWCRDQIEINIQEQDMFHTGCNWYILNKTSYSGMAMIGSYAPLAFDQNFTENCIRNLPKTSELMHSVKEVKIYNLDYSFLLFDRTEHENTFVFLDPPYDIKDNLYGNNGDMHRGFDHQLFAEKVMECKHKWMITYNDNPTLVGRFKDYRQVPWDLQYTMKAAKRDGQEGSATTGKSGKKGKELLIMNY